MTFRTQRKQKAFRFRTGDFEGCAGAINLNEGGIQMLTD
jgi:hypothetical protein